MYVSYDLSLRGAVETPHLLMPTRKQRQHDTTHNSWEIHGNSCSK